MLTVVVQAEAAGVVTTRVAVSAQEADPDLGNNKAEGATMVLPVADLGVAAWDAPDPVLAGTPLTYTVVLSNAGPSMAEAVLLTDTFGLKESAPSGAAYLSYTSTQGICAEIASDEVLCNLGSVQPDALVTITIATRPAPASGMDGLVTNTVAVSSAASDPNPDNNIATVTTRVDPVADLSVSIADSPDPVLVDSVLAYMLIIHNAGPSAAPGVQITQTLPISVTLPVVETSLGSCDASGRLVTCALDTLPVGTTDGLKESAAVTVTVQVASAGSLVSTAEIASAAADLSLDNNTDTETTSAVLELPFYQITLPLILRNYQ